MKLMNILTLMGGLGLFLYGMKMMGEGLELVAGSRLRRLLEVLTTNRFMGLFVGFLVTAIIQSSSATTVMVVGFVNAGLMSLSQAVGVIMGANIGTTTTSALIALKLTSIAPVLILLGVVMQIGSKRQRVNQIGHIVIGFGILFFGMNIMSEAMKPLQHSQAFANMLSLFTNPLLGILAGLVLTAVIQSSSASIGILQALAISGVINVGQSMYVLFGQNIGTCVTAMLASIGTTKTAKRAAVIHLLFNIIGTVIFVVITLLIPFREIVEKIIPNNVVAQIAFVHIIFNVVTTFILIPFINVLVRASTYIVRGTDKIQEELSLEYLDPRILNTPAIAVSQVLKEVERMADLVQETITKAMKSFIELDEKAIPEVLQNERIINFLNKEITDYLVKINALELQEEDSKVIGSLYHVVNDLERIGDHAENITEFTQDFIAQKYKFSDAARSEIIEVNNKVLEVVDIAFTVFRQHKYDKDIIDFMSDIEQMVDDLTDKFKENHIARLNRQECSSAVGVYFVEILNNLERVSDHATNVAYSLNSKKSYR